MTSLIENRSSHEYSPSVESLTFPKQRDICSLSIHSNSQLKYKLREDSLDKLETENDADSGCIDGMTSPSKLDENTDIKSACPEEVIKSDQVPTDASQLLRNILQNKEKGTSENNNTKEMFSNNVQLGESKRSDRHMIDNIIPAYGNEEDRNSINSGDVSCDGSDYGSSNEHLNNVDDIMDHSYEADSPTENGSYSTEDSKEAKRARVENILSNMRPSSCGSPDQNGSNFQEGRRQKRKQYQPIQHDPYWPDHSNFKYRKLEKMALQEQQFKLKQQLHLVQKRIVELSDDEQDDENEKISGKDFFMEKNILEVPRIRDYNNRLLQNSDSSKQFKGQGSTSINSLDNGKHSVKHEKKMNITKNQPLQKLDLENLTNSLKCGITDALNSVVDTIFNKYLEDRSTKTNEKGQEKCKKEQEDVPKETKPKEEMKPKEPEPVAPISRISSHREPFHHDLRHDHIGNMARILEKTSAFETPRGLTPEIHRHPHHPLPFPLPFTYFPTQMMHPPSMYSCAPPTLPEPEQTEALPLVVNSSSGTPKKKRTKVTDTRLSPRAARALLGQEPIPLNPSSEMERHHPTSFPTLIPPALPTSVAIPNPSLQESTLMSFYRDHTPFSDISSRNHSPMHGDHPSPGNNQSPSDSLNQMMKFDSMESGSDSYDSHNMHMISFLNMKLPKMHSTSGDSTLTPMHLRKAKLMFFYVRYPSSAILKVYFPDVKFNKNNTAQLVKWFSNFREFFYIQMEKYARQSIAEGFKHADELIVTTESELYRVLNLHYNRNNQIDVPDTFRVVVQATLREFYRALIASKDQEPSWKKSIYKVIARMDDSIPEYFKSPNWMEQLGDM